MFFPLFLIIVQKLFVNFLITLNNLSNKPREEKNKITDKRVKLTNEMIESIRLIKMYAWEKAISEPIKKLR